VKGLPAKPISGTSPASARRTWATGIEHVAQMFIRVRDRQIADLPLLAQRAREARALSFDELQTQPHRIRYRQYVGEHDRCIEASEPAAAA
jgi:hypothetical protein